MTTVVSDNMLASVEVALEDMAKYVRDTSKPEELQAAVNALEFGMACFVEGYGLLEEDYVLLSMRALHAMTQEKLKHVKWRKTLN